MLGVSRIDYYRMYLAIILLSLISAVLVVTTHLLFEERLGLLFSSILIFITLAIGYTFTFAIVLKKIKRHERITKNILNTISDVILVKNADGKFVYSNQSLASLYNTTPEEMIGKDDFEFINNRHQADKFRTNAQLIMKTMRPEEVYETSTDVKTGEVRHFHSIKIPYLNTKNKKRLMIIAKDITEIINLKQETERNKIRLEHVLDVSEEGLWEWNVKTNQVINNERWEIITGIPRSQNSYTEFEKHILDEDKENFIRVIQGILNHNQAYNIEYRIRKPNGEIIWIWDRGKVSEYDQAGKPIWIAGLILDITEEKANQDKVHNLAYYDQLTGLINRSQLEVELNNTLEKNREKQSHCALLFLDLNRFKLMNDSYGHHMGDKLLKIIAKRLNNCNSEPNIIARFGGDEFVIILPLFAKDSATAIGRTQKYAEKLIAKVSSNLHLKSEHKHLDIECSITTSVGGVVFKSDETTAEMLLQLADMALYRAKANGGQTAQIFEASHQDELSQTTHLQKTMLNCDIEREFCIYLQPKFNRAHEIIGAEALVRWQHPELGLLAPASFIEMAEENNMILPIGATVLHQACRQLKQWQSHPSSKHLVVSINLSAKQIWQSQFVDEFISVIDSYHIDHTKLILEVTESVLIQDINDATEKLIRLKQHGVSISLDDFGTGYSSLNYLRTLPIDEIKIDRSFVQDLVHNHQSHLVVKSIIDLANNFNLRIVSEGVEDSEQLEILKKYQVPYYQGFFLSKPLAIQEFEQLLAHHLSLAS